MTFDLTQYLSRGIENLIKSAVKTTLTNPGASAFLLSYARQAKKSAEIRSRFEMSGEHIPPFLIMSITSDCNLRCAGCYARHGGQNPHEHQFPAEEWARLFSEAGEIGVSMILLAGGEPFMRRDVLERAAPHKNILFPVFTNGTLWDEDYARLFKKNRNLMPIISLEGGEAETDARRGDGVHGKVWALMTDLDAMGLLFGVSVTVTRENLSVVTDDATVARLRAVGCKIIFYVEYVPVESPELALDDAGRTELDSRIGALRAQNGDTLFISFPGDESTTGGCLAAGRGFFHINASGGAEPCPFSPYSDTDMRDKSLREALRSPLFARLRESELLKEEHTGGCVLFEKEDIVARMIHI